MTAFDNIKVNNWPATSNDFEDFLVLELPLNESAALVESRRDIVVSDKVLHPKVALTNSGVNAKRAGVSVTDAGTITGSPWADNHHMQWAFRDGLDTYGDPSTSNSAAFASNGGTYKIVFADGGYSVSTNIVLKFYINGGNIKVNAGETDEQEFTSSDGSGFQTWTIAASSVSQLKNVQLTNSGNTGPYWSGIYVDSVQIANPPGGPKKHYDNNAVFNSSVLTTTAPVPRKGESRTLEFWAYMNSGASSWQNIIAYGTNSDSKCFGINRGNSDSSNIAFTGFSGGDWDTGVSVASYLDTWTHFSVSYDSGVVEIFLNGVSIGTANRTLDTGGSNFVIGASEHSGNQERFDGAIQDVRVYNKKIRTGNFTPPGAILG